MVEQAAQNHQWAEPDIETRPQEEGLVGEDQIDRGVDRGRDRRCDLILAAASSMAPMKQAAQAAAKSCTAARGGSGSLMSRWSSVLRSAPLAPTVVRVVLVKRSFSVVATSFH
jgi:hypothetical protein